jgi:Ca2+/H+ antiporter, TMEM165/GDT1 family
MYRVVVLETGQGFKAHDRQFFSQCGRLGPAACTCVRAPAMLRAGEEKTSTHTQETMDGAETNAAKMLLPALTGSKQPWGGGRYGTIAAVHPFLVSAAVVAVAELGDKTQLLALVLAARFRKPGVILAGILCATIANHLIAGAVGAWVASQVRPPILRLIVAAAFLVMAVWTLIPDRQEARDEPVHPRFGVFGTTLVAFFLAEMGDKTQIATATLAARYQTLLPVVAGSALGMLAMDALAILVGEVAAQRLPLKLIRAIAAVIFVLLAGMVLRGAGS